MGSHQKAQLLMGEGKLNGIAPLILHPMLPGRVGQYMIEPILQIGEGQAPHLTGKPVDAPAQVFDNLQADSGIFQNQAFKARLVEAADEGVLRAGGF